MQRLPTTLHRSASDGGASASSKSQSRRRAPAAAGATRRRLLLWLWVGATLLVAFAVIRSLLQAKALHSQRAAPSPASATASAGGAETLLDGRPIARPLPSVFPNGERSRFRCDLPSLRYQCDLDAADGCKAYPQLFPAGELLRHWPSHDTTAPSETFSSLCRFNISSPYERALARVFHAMEVPFVMYGVPELDAAAARWDDAYLTQQLGPDELYLVSVFNSSHFLYYRRSHAGPSDPPSPHEPEAWTYPDFVEYTRRRDAPVPAAAAGPAAASKLPPFAYLMLFASDIRDRAAFVLRDLAFLDPASAATSEAYGDLFLRDKAEAARKGLRCRIGVRGIVSDGHVDAGLNMVAMVRGAKRYVLSPPSVCGCLGLLPSGPSARHTTVDWDRVARERTAPHFGCAATEVVVSTGDVLYIPSFWYHHIVALDQSIQCNARSGVITRPVVREALERCGLTVA
ncbi:hypothetical protein P43SY_007073 [Pythium insidiosum]|uniref:JmjC domain-containing protein n=1 Tax=Pythium insidiosum TaxID=114742 RepID=A0AAD5QDA5_PYTIN|nr:hypothetical protein P43SY_007073 [Pythium insidiosum]